MSTPATTISLPTDSAAHALSLGMKAGKRYRPNYVISSDGLTLTVQMVEMPAAACIDYDVNGNPIVVPPPLTDATAFDAAGTAAAAVAAEASARTAAIAVLTAGSPSQLDTFLETYNRFLTDESAASALTTVVAGKEPIITAGTTAQYWRGDKTWQAFPSIPAAQVNSDWNAGSGVAQILNKPTLGTAAAQNTSAFDAAGVAASAVATETAARVAAINAISLTPGPTGPQGASGSNGSNGSNGLAATVSVGTVTTGSAGTSALVVNSGTTSAAVFNFTIPKGDKGDTGSAGSAGTNGTNGTNGSNGATGATGSSGVVTVNSPLTNSGTSTAANLSISPATDTAPGSISAADKTKIDKITPPAVNVKDRRLILAIDNVNCNAVGDVAVFSGLPAKYQVLGFKSGNASVSLLAATKGGLFTGAGATGSAIVADTLLSLGLALTRDYVVAGAFANTIFSGANLYYHESVALGLAGTCSLYLEIFDLT